MKLPLFLALPVLALLPAAAHATDVSGLWIVTSSLAQAPATIDCSIMQIGVQLQGWCEPESADATPVALTGKLDRTQATWAYDLNVQGQTVHLAYVGNLNPDTLGMTGQLTYGTSSAGLSAVRK
jgi:hypothetical protein